MSMQYGHAVEVKSVEEAGVISGYGSVFNNRDQGGDVVLAGAFAESIKGRQPKMLWGHDFFEPPIGRWTEVREDDRGLFVKGQLNMDSQRGREVHSALKMKAVDGLSIGYITKDFEDKDDRRELKSVDLFEVSVVNFPMNELASVDDVKAAFAAGMTTRQLECILRDAGFTRSQAKALIADGGKALVTRDAGGGDLDELAESLLNLSSILRNGNGHQATR